MRHVLAGTQFNALDLSLGTSMAFPRSKVDYVFSVSRLRRPVWLQAGLGYVHRSASATQFRVGIGVSTLGASALDECPPDPTSHQLETCGRYQQAFSSWLPWVQLAVGWGGGTA